MARGDVREVKVVFRWEGMIVEMDRSGISDTWEKTINVHIVNTQICLRISTG